MTDLTETYITSIEVANILGIHPKSAGLLVRKGKIPVVKIANRWLVPRAVVDEFAKDYEGRRGKLRTKRKYTEESEMEYRVRAALYARVSTAWTQSSSFGSLWKRSFSGARPISQGYEMACEPAVRRAGGLIELR